MHHNHQINQTGVQIMRLAFTILGIILGAISFIQAFLIASISGAIGQTKTTEEGSALIFIALAAIVASGILYKFPRASMIIYLIAGGIALAGATVIPDMRLWGGVWLFFAVMAFFGIGEKRRSEIRKDAKQKEYMQSLFEAGKASATTN
jgi:hypothetical protein